MALQTRKLDVSAVDTYTATFSFNFNDFASRVTVPDRVYFNASGTMHSFSPVPAYTSGFPDWATNYTTSSWSAPTSVAAPSLTSTIQAGQIPFDTTSGFTPGNIVVSRISFSGTWNLNFSTFTNDTYLPGSPNFDSPAMGLNVPLKPHAMIITRSRIYLFWIGLDSKIHMREHNGTAPSNEVVFTNTDTNDAYGLGGCLVKKSGNEYVAIAYGKSPNEINIAYFPDGNLSMIATQTITVSNFSTNQADLCQNPRTGHTYLTWLDGSTIKYKKSNTPENFDFPAGETVISGNWQGLYSFSMEGFDNFEIDFALPESGGTNVIKNIVLKSTDQVQASFTKNGNVALFPYTFGANHYVGAIYSDVLNLYFTKRLLNFPRNFEWQKSLKILHLEGPPYKNTIVSAETDFAEIATASCLAETANAAGGRTPFVGQTNVIASSGNIISIFFDKDMNLNAGLVGSQIKLLDPDNNPKNLIFNAALTRELRFRLNEDLDFNTNYRIIIASDVFDANGSQIWSDSVLSFTTQPAASYLLASEVTSITAYSDAARTAVIANGSEVNATSTIYLRIIAADPAFNTFDTATVSVFLNGTQISQITLSQPSPNSNIFDGVYSLTAPNGGNNTYEFVSPDSTVKTSVRIDFPTLSSVFPPDLSTGVLINTQPQLIFSESILPSSANTDTVKLTRSGSAASFNVSVSGNTITIDPNDTPENYLRTDTIYQIAAGYGLRDLHGNPFITSPATFTSQFTTQASQTRPISISAVKIYSDAAYTTLLSPMADYAATGTVYLEFSGVDGSNLTKDYAIASISTGAIMYLAETASSSAIYRGSYTFAGLSDRFELKAQSVKTPAASASLLITYPRFNPVFPASGTTNIPVSASIRILADEPIIAADINATTVKLEQNGAAVSASRNYNPVTREITITPDALLDSEKTYKVTVNGLRDIVNNPQIEPLVYQFKTEDIIPPTITGFTPSQGETGVTIDRVIAIYFSESISAASGNTSTVKLSRGGMPASYSVSVIGNKLIIDPDDTVDSLLRTQTTYVAEIGPSIKDLAGNGLSNVPATFTLSFSTQPANTPPTSITSLTIFKDPLLLQGWSANENVPASATVYLKVTGTDGATQTRDIATVTLDLSWTSDLKLSIQETASNSTGYYIGQFDLGSIPLYGVPNPKPALSIGSLTFYTDQAPANAATLSIIFPALVSGETLVTTLAGNSIAAGATNVRVDSSIITSFNEELLNAGDAVSFRVASGLSDIAGIRTLSSDRKKIIFTPSSPMPYSSRIDVSAIYSDNGLKSQVGNPLYREFSYSFTTQASQTAPFSISQVNLFSDNSFSAFSSYSPLADFPGSGTIYIELKGIDSAPNTVDSTTAIVNTGANVILTETSASSGIFRGFYSYSGLADGFNLNVSSAITPGASQTLKLSYPALSQLIPASGASDVSVYSPVSIRLNEDIDLATLNSTNIRLLKNGITTIPTTYSWNGSSLKTIEITPDSPLDFSSFYIVQISGIKDLVGNQQITTFYSSFSTQATAMSPTAITDLKAYSDSLFSTQIPDNGLVAPGANVYFEVKAIDLSATTIDSTTLRMTSSVTAATAQIVLIETGPSTGIFRGNQMLFSDENATLTITSETDTAFFTRIKTYAFPLISQIQPASGTNNIYLDTRFLIRGNKSFNASTISTSSIILSDSTGIVSYTPVLFNPTDIYVYSDLKQSSDVYLKLDTSIKDTDGLSFPQTLARFKTVTPVLNSFRIYSDSSYSTQIASGSQVEAGQPIYARITGNDSYLYRAEFAGITYKTDISTYTAALPEVSPGVFESMIVIPDEPGKILQLFPENAINLRTDLEILPKFTLVSYSPASGAVSVPADVWPSWNFSRPVDPAFVNTAHFKLTKVADGSEVTGIVSRSPTDRQIRFQPNSILQLLTEYEMSVSSSVKDTNGNLLGSSLATRFKTQPPPPPPTVISSFDNYESDAYATATRVVATNGTLYLRMISVDVSFSTYETARVRIDSSDGTFDGAELVMVEESPPSGIFNLVLPVNLPTGTTLTVQPQAAPAKAIVINVFPRTKLVSVLPASGTSGLLLDTPLSLTFSQPIDVSTVDNGLRLLASGSNEVNFTANSQNSGKTIEMSCILATGATHELVISTSLKDSNGLFLLPEVINYTSAGETNAELELLTGIAPLTGQKVSFTGEAAESEIKIVATTTNLYSSTSEFRAISINAGTQTFELAIPEVNGQQGFFSGNFSPPAGIAKNNLKATLNFASRPTINFNIASQPLLLSVSPASNSVNVSEFPIFTATFSRLMSSQTGARSASVIGNNIMINLQLINATDSSTLSWVSSQPLPLQASFTLHLNGLTDYLGQELSETLAAFSTGGTRGINLYKDSAYTLQIATDQIDVPLTFAEVAASSTTSLGGRTFNLLVRTGTKATSTLSLPLIPAVPGSGKFRCSLELEPTKSQPQYSVPLLPGEWLELTSPELTADKKIFYYRFSGSVSPTKINGIEFFYEKNFAQPLFEVLPLPTLYIQVNADDLNWFTSDRTPVKVTSDADRTGIRLLLEEAGTHSHFFRGAVSINGNFSDESARKLLVQPGQRIYVQSETDMSVHSSILYLPQNSLIGVSVFPSPVRGNSLFFRFYLNFIGDIEIKIYDTAGDEIDTLAVLGREGENKIEWRLPRNLANGVYFYVIKLKDSTAYPKGKRKARGKFAVLR
ncbi:MAG: hypothetical protein Kow0029_08800 [Candidatus Rifleibacteriota bacterium]